MCKMMSEIQNIESGSKDVFSKEGTTLKKDCDEGC